MKWMLVLSSWNHSPFVLSSTFWGTGCHPVFRLEVRLTPTQLGTKVKSMWERGPVLAPKSSVFFLNMGRWTKSIEWMIPNVTYHCQSYRSILFPPSTRTQRLSVISMLHLNLKPASLFFHVDISKQISVWCFCCLNLQEFAYFSLFNARG